VRPAFDEAVAVRLDVGMVWTRKCNRIVPAASGKDSAA
jgi:hypothetical protein